MASGTARGRVRTTTTTATTTVELRKMAAILQIIGWQGHENSVYSVLLWHWTFMTWSIDTCQNKVSADQHHVTISRAQVYNSSRSCVFWKLTADQVLVFRLDRGLMSRFWKQDRIVRKPVKASPGSKFIRIITYKTQIKILLFPSWVSLIGHWTARPGSYAFRLA